MEFMREDTDSLFAGLSGRFTACLETLLVQRTNNFLQCERFTRLQDA